MTRMDGRDIYVRITNAKGEAHVREHRVWDADKFVNKLTDEGKSSKKAEDRFKVEMVTKADYQNERKSS